MTLCALIFDIDGTLAETEEAHREAFNRAFTKVDLPWHLSRDDYRWLLQTTGGKARLRVWQAARPMQHGWRMSRLPRCICARWRSMARSSPPVACRCGP